MNHHRRISLTILILLAAIVFGSFATTASAAPKGEQTAVDIRKANEGFGVNASGMTYGSAMDVEPENEPDLILARGIDGTVGYIKASDCNPPEFSSPEEALAWQENVGYPDTIPLYTEDGVTVIGAYKIG